MLAAAKEGDQGTERDQRGLHEVVSQIDKRRRTYASNVIHGNHIII